jgi:hypothetical protein
MTYRALFVTWLGEADRQADQLDQAHAALSGAIELYRGMGMTFWLAGAEVVLAQMA